MNRREFFKRLGLAAVATGAAAIVKPAAAASPLVPFTFSSTDKAQVWAGGVTWVDAEFDGYTIHRKWSAADNAVHFQRTLKTARRLMPDPI